jgi:hypothetical protein
MPRGRVVLEPFAPLAPADATALATDAGEVVRYLTGDGAAHAAEAGGER